MLIFLIGVSHRKASAATAATTRNVPNPLPSSIALLKLSSPHSLALLQLVELPPNTMATQGQTQMPGRSEKGKGGIVLYSPQYFAACTLGGIIACGPTHTCKSLQLLSSL